MDAAAPHLARRFPDVSGLNPSKAHQSKASPVLVIRCGSTNVNLRTKVSQMAWALLTVAGVLEIAFAFSMKTSDGFTRLIPGLLTIATGVSSVFLLSLSLRTLPVGTGYAVWTGIGAAGTALVGIAFLGDSAAPMRMLCIGLILAGVIGLKMIS